MAQTTIRGSRSTNPPAITVVWPPDQSQIAGTNFSLRGILDDDTATISVTGLGTNAIAGTVERGGTFRVANLPLLSPTNVLTLTASNAAGYSSTTELTVFQSSVTVTVDPISPASLSQSFITVTGEINDTNEVLSVNGIQAGINADGTWEADNVPVMDHNATADFDLDITAPTNQPPAPDPVATVAVAMPSVVRVAAYTEVYNRQWNSSFYNYIANWTRTRSWEEGANGSSRQHYIDQFGSECDSLVSWPAFWPDGYPLTGHDCAGNYDGTPALPWLCYGGLQLAADSSTYDQSLGRYSLQTSSSRRVQTALELAAGGPAQSGVSRLVLLTVSVAGFSQPLDLSWPGNASAIYGQENYYDYFTGDIPVAATNIAVNGQAVTPSATNPAVGQVLVTQPAGSVQSLQITVSGTNSQAYSVNAQAQDVAMTIFANGLDLATNTPEFCVGQQVIFSNSYSPPLTNIMSRVAKWTFGGTYVNAYTQLSSTGSTNYFANSDLLTNEVTSNWWVSGGTSPAATYTARFAENLTLSNGNQIVFTAQGQFNMSRPTAVMINPAIHGTPTNLWLTPWNAFFFGKAGLGITASAGGSSSNMSYYVQVQSPDFHGYAKITQLCTLSGSGISSVTNYLDNEDPYPGAIDIVLTNLINTFTGQTNNLVQLDDAPQNGGFFSFNLSGSFTDYVMFTPNGAADIYVPIGKLTWSTSFGASYPSTNLAPNSVSGPLGPDNSYDWPVWSNVFSNPN